MRYRVQTHLPPASLLHNRKKCEGEKDEAGNGKKGEMGEKDEAGNGKKGEMGEAGKHDKGEKGEKGKNGNNGEAGKGEKGEIWKGKRSVDLEDTEMALADLARLSPESAKVVKAANIDAKAARAGFANFVVACVAVSRCVIHSSTVGVAISLGANVTSDRISYLSSLSAAYVKASPSVSVCSAMHRKCHHRAGTAHDVIVALGTTFTIVVAVGVIVAVVVDSVSSQPRQFKSTHWHQHGHCRRHLC